MQLIVIKSDEIILQSTWLRGCPNQTSRPHCARILLLCFGHHDTFWSSMVKLHWTHQFYFSIESGKYLDGETLDIVSNLLQSKRLINLKRRKQINRNIRSVSQQARFQSIRQGKLLNRSCTWWAWYLSGPTVGFSGHQRWHWLPDFIVDGDFYWLYLWDKDKTTQESSWLEGREIKLKEKVFNDILLFPDVYFFF